MKGMNMKNRFLFLLVLLVSVLLAGWQFAMAQSETNEPDATFSTVTYLPIVAKHYPWYNPFGVESNALLRNGTPYLQHSSALPAGWLRMNGRISWRALQPNEGDPIDWSKLAGFEAELRAIRDAGIRPIVIVDDYPRWATDNTVRDDGQPTSCGPLLPERYDDFAAFMTELVMRYRTSEFNVHEWEMGNEPDVDPNLVSPDMVFGCWGDYDELYYNGDAYGEMLKVVTPAVRAADPIARVWIGGLLLDNPNTQNPNHIGRPELFLKGILEAGAAPYFDVVAYHGYVSYNGKRVDQDTAAGRVWDSWGGIMLGKARFLRDIMSDYGVDKPLFADETGMTCIWCTPDQPDMLQMQADFLVRAFPRSLSEDIIGFTWFTLDGPGFYNSSLLDINQNPRPVYYAYQTLISNLVNAEYYGTANYGAGIEGYEFRRDWGGADGRQAVHIVWAYEDVTLIAAVPQSDFIAAYTRDGDPISPTPSGDDYLFSITFEPIYIIRKW